MDKNRGFTLIELVAVITLMAVILGLVPLYIANTLPSAKLKATVREISSTIRMARSMAMFTGKEQVVTLDLDERLYRLEGRGSREIPKWITVRVEDPVHGEMHSGKWRLIFTSGGNTARGKIVLLAGNKSITIMVDPIVGTVAVAE